MIDNINLLKETTIYTNLVDFRDWREQQGIGIVENYTSWKTSITYSIVS